MDRALRNIVIWAAAMTFVFFTMIYPAFAHAHGSSHPKDSDSAGSPIRPCFIVVTATGTVVNANLVRMIRAGSKEISGESGVVFYFDRYQEVKVLTPDPAGTVKNFVDATQQCR